MKKIEPVLVIGPVLINVLDFQSRWYSNCNSMKIRIFVRKVNTYLPNMNNLISFNLLVHGQATEMDMKAFGFF